MLYLANNNFLFLNIIYTYCVLWETSQQYCLQSCSSFSSNFLGVQQRIALVIVITIVIQNNWNMYHHYCQCLSTQLLFLSRLDDLHLDFVVVVDVDVDVVIYISVMYKHDVLCGIYFSSMGVLIIIYPYPVSQRCKQTIQME